MQTSWKRNLKHGAVSTFGVNKKERRYYLNTSEDKIGDKPPILSGLSHKYHNGKTFPQDRKIENKSKMKKTQPNR